MNIQLPTFIIQQGDNMLRDSKLQQNNSLLCMLMITVNIYNGRNSKYLLILGINIMKNFTCYNVVRDIWLEKNAGFFLIIRKEVRKEMTVYTGDQYKRILQQDVFLYCYQLQIIDDFQFQYIII
ncbi:Hypothetical_protein [Hexamita inflata]|uniref:Hypothetical_protein n=1 Tax=Hexamita inflata TaxID=28002 RepID=A0AA86PSS3_9EUKA|nr:Hypothetical protein HINF_LOCUS31751 [Hexamita inflata]